MIEKNQTLERRGGETEILVNSDQNYFDDSDGDDNFGPDSPSKKARTIIQDES